MVIILATDYKFYFSGFAFNLLSYDWFLNNMGLKCSGPLIHIFFKLVNTTVQLDRRLIESKNVEPLKQRSQIYERPKYNLYSEFWLCRGLMALSPMLFKGQLCFIFGEYFPHCFSKSIQIFSIQFHKIFPIFPSLDYSLPSQLKL